MKISRRNLFTKAIQATALISIPTVFGSFLESCKNTIIDPTSAQLMKTISGTYTGSTVIVYVCSSSTLASIGITAMLIISGGSTFDVNGKVTQYPTGSLLPKYQITLSANQLMVKV